MIYVQNILRSKCISGEDPMAYNNQDTRDRMYYLLAALFGELPYIVYLLTQREVNTLFVLVEYPNGKV